ncbi:MAG: chemotaxis protein CheW [Scytolyngbya sp. HA4215-MV1]|jgi:positive phototaxis protein PixI|nr:chemotaxis protein CheW [Scytolyngbya sp. HA4215-MV1]
MTSIAPPQSSTQQFLSFRLSSTTQAMISTQKLTEILSVSLSQIISIPDVPSQVMGVCNWRGEILWLVDLALLLGFEPLFSQRDYQAGYRAIVVHHRDYTLGLMVDRVSQMLWCDPQQFQPIPSTQMTPTLSRCLQGYWLSEAGETFLVLNAEAIAEYFQS